MLMKKKSEQKEKSGSGSKACSRTYFFIPYFLQHKCF